MNNNGYSMLISKQLELIYGKESPYNNSKTLTRFKHINFPVINKLIEKDIHKMAQHRNFNIRQKDEGVILSPISFTLFLKPILYTPIVLSPVIFSPLIMAPSLLGPVVSF